jgi:hypothetical protein
MEVACGLLRWVVRRLHLLRVCALTSRRLVIVIVLLLGVSSTYLVLDLVGYCGSNASQDVKQLWLRS